MTISILPGSDLVNLAVFFLWTFTASLGMPGGLVLIVSSGALSNTVRELAAIMILGVAASTLGDLFAYELARKFSPYIAKMLKRFSWFKDNETRAREILKKTEFPLIFFTRFALTPLCVAVSYISGFEKLDRKKYYIAVFSGEILYGTIYPLVGFVFKETWNDLTSVIIDIATVLILVTITAILIKRFIPSRQGRELRR
jgi:membrane protein DedA with SNARE-associated domain